MNKDRRLIRIINSILESYGCKEREEVEFLLILKGRSRVKMELNKIADMSDIYVSLLGGKDA